MLTTAALAPRSGRRAGAAGVDGTRSRPWATDTVSPDGAQPRRGSARVPRGPAIPAARARRPRRRAQTDPVRTRTRLGSVVVAIFWAACSPAHVPVEVRPALATAPVSDDPDDPAVWIHASVPERSLILGTNKAPAPNGALVVFGLDGKVRQTLAGIDRPNNVDVEYGADAAGPGHGHRGPDGALAATIASVSNRERRECAHRRLFRGWPAGIRRRGRRSWGADGARPVSPPSGWNSLRHCEPKSGPARWLSLAIPAGGRRSRPGQGNESARVRRVQRRRRNRGHRRGRRPRLRGLRRRTPPHPQVACRPRPSRSGPRAGPLRHGRVLGRSRRHRDLCAGGWDRLHHLHRSTRGPERLLYLPSPGDARQSARSLSTGEGL